MWNLAFSSVMLELVGGVKSSTAPGHRGEPALLCLSGRTSLIICCEAGSTVAAMGAQANLG